MLRNLVLGIYARTTCLKTRVLVGFGSFFQPTGKSSPPLQISLASCGVNVRIQSKCALRLTEAAWRQRRLIRGSVSPGYALSPRFHRRYYRLAHDSRFRLNFVFAHLVFERIGVEEVPATSEPG
jgi:hypothetical protein